MRGTSHHAAAGFTIVEMLVTLVLAGIFLTFFIQMYRATNAQQLSLIRQSIANDIARSNLSKFPTVASISSPSYTCDPSTGSGNVNNLQYNAQASGSSILGSKTEATPTNLGTVTQEVRARSPQGCGTDKPVQIISRVTYGFAGQPTNTVEYSTYVF